MWLYFAAGKNSYDNTAYDLHRYMHAREGNHSHDFAIMQEKTNGRSGSAKLPFCVQDLSTETWNFPGCDYQRSHEWAAPFLRLADHYLSQFWVEWWGNGWRVRQPWSRVFLIFKRVLHSAGWTSFSKPGVPLDKTTLDPHRPPNSWVAHSHWPQLHRMLKCSLHFSFFSVSSWVHRPKRSHEEHQCSKLQGGIWWENAKGVVVCWISGSFEGCLSNHSDVTRGLSNGSLFSVKLNSSMRSAIVSGVHAGCKHGFDFWCRAQSVLACSEWYILSVLLVRCSEEYHSGKRQIQTWLLTDPFLRVQNSVFFTWFYGGLIGS